MGCKCIHCNPRSQLKGDDRLAQNLLRSLNQRIPPSQDNSDAALVAYEQQQKEIQKRKDDCKKDFEVGFCIVDKQQSKNEFWANLFKTTSKDEQELIKSLNIGLSDNLLPSQIVIIPTRKSYTFGEDILLSEVEKEINEVNEAVSKLESEEASFLYNGLETLISVWDKGLPTDPYATSSGVFGALTGAAAANFQHIGELLMDINNLYVEQVNANSQAGAFAANEDFIKKRDILFKRLDGELNKLSMKALNIPEYSKMKNTLGLSSKSIIHNASEIKQSNYIPNLAQRMKLSALAVQGAKGAGYVGIVLGAASGMDSIYKACNVDGSGECAKTTTIEISGFIGGVAGGNAGGALSIALVTPLVIGSAPLVFSLAIVGAAVSGGLVGGTIGGGGGKVVGEILYQIGEWATDIIGDN